MFSVVIPAYNAEKTLARAVGSALGQTLGDLEVIVVDDGSTDGTARVAAEFGGAVTYVRQDRSGASVARNTGIARARGEWIAFLDADDEFLPPKLEEQRDLLARNPGLCWCACNYLVSNGERRAPRYDPGKLARALRGREAFASYFWEGAIHARSLATPTMVIHRSVFAELGGFEPGRVRSQDVDVWWRIAHRYPTLGYLAEPLAVVHLDSFEPTLVARRKEAKRGKDIRALVARHLALAAEAGDRAAFAHFAGRQLRGHVLAMLYHGYLDDARDTVAEFGELFGAPWHLAVRALGRHPELSARAIRAAVDLARRLRLTGEVHRRWPGQPPEETPAPARAEPGAP